MIESFTVKEASKIIRCSTGLIYLLCMNGSLDMIKEAMIDEKGKQISVDRVTKGSLNLYIRRKSKSWVIEQLKNNGLNEEQEKLLQRYFKNYLNQELNKVVCDKINNSRIETIKSKGTARVESYIRLDFSNGKSLHICANDIKNKFYVY